MHLRRVIELPVVPGQHVKKGDLLARIDPRDFEQAQAAAKAKYVESARNTERYRTLYAKQLVATADLQANEKDTDINKADLEKAEKALEDTTLVAPFDGIVSQRLIENYQNVRAGDAVVHVQKLDKLKVIIHMPEKDAGTTSSVDRNKVRGIAVFAAAPDREFPLIVTEWETEADAATQTFLVKLIMDQPQGVNILPGMTATVRLSLPTAPLEAPSAVFIIPSHAVFYDERGAACVWVVDNKELIVHKRMVALGQVIGTGKIEVKAGLVPGDVVVIAGVRQLREGMKVSL